MLVLMDTNACIYVIKNRVDLMESLHNAVDSKVELAVLKESMLEAKRLALAEEKAFNRFVEAFKPRVVEGGRKSVDGAVIAYAVRSGCVVCTGDAALRKKLKEKGVSVLVFKKGGAVAVT